jgi:hypothetical protein
VTGPVREQPPPAPRTKRFSRASRCGGRRGAPHPVPTILIQRTRHQLEPGSRATRWRAQTPRSSPSRVPVGRAFRLVSAHSQCEKRSSPGILRGPAVVQGVLPPQTREAREVAVGRHEDAVVLESQRRKVGVLYEISPTIRPPAQLAKQGQWRRSALRGSAAGALRQPSTNDSTMARGVGGRNMAGCVLTRMTAARTGSNRATGTDPLSVEWSHRRYSEWRSHSCRRA